MFLPRDARFDDEEERYALRWQCEDCVLWDEARGCAHGYPADRHRKTTHDRSLVVFCKDFDLA